MEPDSLTTPRFALGAVVVTVGVQALIEREALNPLTYLHRHLHGDWGDVDPEDWQANQSALEHGDRLLSVYRLNDALTLWIITEWDRSATTLLLPSEY